MNTPPEKKIWFPAKKHGYGWGFPNCWQGWLIMVAFFVAVGAGFFYITPLSKYGLAFYVLYVFVLSIALVAICYIKGEKPTLRE